MESNGTVGEQYEIMNSENAWDVFRSRYMDLKPEIALEVSTTGKYVARMLRDMGFSVHMAEPAKLALIFNTAKKNHREDSYKLANSSGLVNCLKSIFHHWNQRNFGHLLGTGDR